MLVRRQQVAAKIEAIEGTAVSPAAADAKLLVINPAYKANIDMHTREIVQASLSKIKSLSGKGEANLTFGLELRGSGTPTTAPEWSKLLKACGFQENAVKALTIGAITTGPFLHGETITQATSNATGRVIIATATGTTTLYFVDLGTGTWDAEHGITGGTSGATATPSAVADAGIEWKPFSTELSQVSIGAITSGPYQAGELITGGTSGAKGYVYAATANGAAVLKHRVVSGSFASGEVITGATSNATCTTSAVATQVEVPTLTLARYNDGIVEKLKGGRGKVKFTIPVGKPAQMDFDFTGVYVTAADAIELSGIAHESTVPPVVLNAAITVNSYAAIIANINLDCNNTIAGRESVNDANGILSHRITARELTGSIDPEMVNVATQDFYGQLKANTEVVLDFTVGSATGNKFRFYVPKAQYTDLSQGDREGIRTAELPFACNGSMSPGDDELTILQL